MDSRVDEALTGDIEPDEVVVGVHESGILLEEGLNTGLRNYCSKCRKNVHCHVKVDDGKAAIIMTCSNDDCECKCRTHFACKRCGKLHPYGKECDYKEEVRKINKKDEAKFKKLMKKWEKSHV